MDVATLTHQRVDAPVEASASLRRLLRDLSQISNTATTKCELLSRVGDLLDRYAEPMALFYFGRDSQGELYPRQQVRPKGEDRDSKRLGQLLLTAAHLCCRNGEVYVQQQARHSRTVLAAPIRQAVGEPEALGIIVSSEHSAPHLLMLTQLIAGQIMTWQASDECSGHNADARDALALVELLDQISAAADLEQASSAVAGQLASFFGCHRVAVGIRRKAKGRCRLVALSGVSRFDKRSGTAHAIESAMDEAILREQLTVWPDHRADSPHAALAHKGLCSLEDAEAVVGVPLQNDEGTVGAIVVLRPRDSRAEAGSPNPTRFLAAGRTSLAQALLTKQRTEGGRLVKLLGKAGRWAHTWRGPAALVLLTAILLAMLIPIPYRVTCECTIEPVTRRFVAAPFEGTLESALVKPGDLVRKGDVLARLDGRELRWKRAATEADRKQATKRRDTAQAAHNYSDQQIAQLEIERLDLQLRLLDYRGEHLEIRSPIDGIVASGDLERAAGAPLTLGQKLFEIAPLENMIVEVSVPDDEISHVVEGQMCTLRLDAFPRQNWQSALTRIQPRAEIRDDENVFVAEARLQNTSAQLRPGMKGRARIESSRRPIGWILFHKPWAFVKQKLSW